MNASSTLFLIAAVTVVVALLYTCPSTGNCPLVQLLGRGGRTSTAPLPKRTGEVPADDEPAAQSEPLTETSEGEERMGTVETKPHYGEVLHADLESFDRVVLRSEAPVLVDFYADWCRPCQMLAPTLEELAQERPDVKIVKIDVERNPELAGHFRVSSIPAVMVFKDGAVVANHLGLADKATLQRLIEG